MSFRLKTILGVALIEAVLLGLLVTSGIRYLSGAAETEFVQRTHATTLAFSAAAKNALIASDLAALGSLTHEMMGYPGVRFARVRDANGALLASAGDAAALAGAPRQDTDIAAAVDGIFNAGAEVREAGTAFGRVELGIAASALAEQNAVARRNGLTLAGLEMALVALFSWLLGSYLTRQLVALRQAARQIADGTLGTQVPVRGSDELAQTAQAFNDMSRRLQASHAELQLRSRAIETSLEGVAIADARLPDLPLTYVNAAFERITGYSSAEVLGRNCRFLQGPDTDPAALATLRSAIAAGTEVKVLLRNVTKGGRPFWNELRLQTVRDENGALTHYVGLQNDVTDRIEAQRALASREADLRRVLDATHDGIVVIDADGRVESFNRGAQQMFGWHADEVVGHDLAMILPEPHRDAHHGHVQRYLRSGESGVMGVEREFEARHKDGQQVWIALRVVELDGGDGGDDGGAAVGGSRRRFLGVIHDITARKQGEIELLRAKDEAEAAATAKSDFLANMSHEIRTPLHGVLGAMEMLSDTPLSGQQLRFIETARTSANMLLGVIDEILDFSRLEAGKLRIESLDFDLRRTVEDVTAVLAQRAHAKRVELACYIAPEVPDTVVGDPIRLRQVLVNLVGNAIKFTDHGEVVVTTGLLRTPGQPDRLHFEVRDTGIGIPPDKRPGLFQPFTQADNSTSRRYGGSGLGLSISRRLVELMGGQIDLDSTPGKGSRFWFTLPLPGAARRARPLRMSALAGTRVLVVDDNATNRIILHRYLTSWSAQSGSAASGDEALAKLQDAASSGHPYDIALLDLNMPGMDGYALLRAIRADAALAGMPLIMLSSSLQDPQRMQGMQVDIWLDKPVRQSDLHDAITTVLNGRQLALAEAPPPARARNETFHGERVLLVEDNAITRDLGLQMLRKAGLDVGSAESGHDAVEAVRRERWDVVLMDIQMPGMDGYEATGTIRRWEAETGRPRLPIIAVTAHALPADRERCLAAGMDDYVVKPYNAATLGTAIARWLMPPGHAGAAVVALDADRLAEVRAVMGEDFEALMAKAAESLTALVVDASKAIGQGELGAARETMHRIKNTAGDIGARRLHEVAGELERTLEAGILPSAELATLQEEASGAARALAALSASHTPPTT